MTASKISKKSITSTRISPNRTKSGKDLNLQANITILDAHVHIHDCFDISNFLDRAHENFFRELEARNAGGETNAVMLLTESHGTNWYDKLQKSAGNEQKVWKNWSIARNDEVESLTATSSSGQILSIVAGRQIVTAENLEILALGFPNDIDDGQPINDVIRVVQSAGALCVLPWGFGKWTGKRGKIVRELLQDDHGSNFFIGDNAGRLALWPAPAEFATAARKNIRILPGSDPLPYKEQVAAAGRFGLILQREIRKERPFEDIRRALVDENVPGTAFGQLERLLPFIKYQVAMQLRKFG